MLQVLELITTREVLEALGASKPLVQLQEVKDLEAGEVHLMLVMVIVAHLAPTAFMVLLVDPVPSVDPVILENSADLVIMDLAAQKAVDAVGDSVEEVAIVADVAALMARNRNMSTEREAYLHTTTKNQTRRGQRVQKV